MAILSYEFIENTGNLLTDAAFAAAASGSDAVGEWVIRNGEAARRIGASPFYTQGNDWRICRGQFKANTSYLFDLWIDVDDVYYYGGGFQVPGGFWVKYTDGSSESSCVATGNINGTEGFKHIVWTSDPSKTIDGIGVYYYIGTPWFLRYDSSVTEVSNPEIYKSGVAKVNSLNEHAYFDTYPGICDNKIYYESDGSAWIRIMHHNNPASYLFNTSNDFSRSNYIDSNRWTDFQALNQVSRWELMVKQGTTAGATTKKFRWVQSYNPLESNYNTAGASYVIKNSSPGYTVSDYSGLYKLNSSAYLVQVDDCGGCWWGACGSWSEFNGGIPAWNHEVVTTGTMDLYLRIYPNTLTTFTKGGNINSNEFIEI